MRLLKIGLICALLQLCGLFLQSVWADWCPTALVAFDWRVTTSEEAWVNPDLSERLKRYPLAWLFDGDASTAWVFEGIKWEGEEREDGYRPYIGKTFGGGVEQWIHINFREPRKIDTFGLINGYAKSQAIYERNNWIKRVRVEAKAENGAALWSKSFELKPSLEMQYFNIPVVEAKFISIEVEDVENGRDNDLCISELQFYNNGRSLMETPPYMLSSDGDECGCGYRLDLIDRRGNVLPIGDFEFPEYSFSTDGKFVALNDYRSLVIIDFATGKEIFRDKAAAESDYISMVEWCGAKRAEYTEVTKQEEIEHIVDLSGAKPKVETTRSPIESQQSD